MKYSKKLDRAVIDREIQEAFDLWSKYTNVTFVPKSMGISNIKVGFYLGDHEDVRPFDGPHGALAHAFFPVIINQL